MTEEKESKESRFDGETPEEPTPVRLAGLRASNTLETLRPKEIQAYQYEKINNAPEAGEPFFRPTNVVNLAVVPVRNTDARATAGLPEELKKFSIPSTHDRLTKLEEQVDALLDRIAKHNQRSSHKI